MSPTINGICGINLFFVKTGNEMFVTFVKKIPKSKLKMLCVKISKIDSVVSEIMVEAHNQNFQNENFLEFFFQF